MIDLCCVVAWRALVLSCVLHCVVLCAACAARWLRVWLMAAKAQAEGIVFGSGTWANTSWCALSQPMRLSGQ